MRGVLEATVVWRGFSSHFFFVFFWCSFALNPNPIHDSLVEQAQMGMVFLMRLLAGSGFTWLLFWLPLGRRAPTRCDFASRV